MKKVRITELQKQMLESKVKAKLQEDISRSESPSAKVSDAFKSGNKIEGFKSENAEVADVETNPWTELVPHVHDLLKQMYTNPSKEGLDQFWDTVGLSWDEIIEMLTTLDLIKSVKGGYRLTKVVENPAKAVKIVAKLIEKMINDKKVPVEEIERDDIKKNLGKQVGGSGKKTGKTKAEILAVIAQKRAEELARRKIEKSKPIGEDNFPAGAKDASDAPFNQSDPEIRAGQEPKSGELDIVWFNEDLAIFHKDGKYYLFNVHNAEKDEYEVYANREKHTSKGENGLQDTEYGKWDINADIVNAYVNDNFGELSKGIGFGDFNNGVDIVEIDRELAEDLLNLRKYIEDPEKAETLTKIVSSLGLEETTSAAGSSGAFVGKLGGGNETPINRSNVASEMNDIIGEVNDTSSIKNEIISKLKQLMADNRVTPSEWLAFEGVLKQIVGLVQSLDDPEWDQLIPFIIGTLQNAETVVEKKNKQAFNDYRENLDGLGSFINHFDKSLGEATTTVSAGGDSGTFAYDAPAGDGSSFWTAGNKMAKKRPVKEDAKKDTQYPKGEFVEFDDCVKYNNNKTAIEGGCSQGAVDNVVKTKTSKNSVISDNALYLEVAKVTGKTLKEVKAIIESKINETN